MSSFRRHPSPPGSSTGSQPRRYAPGVHTWRNVGGPSKVPEYDCSAARRLLASRLSRAMDVRARGRAKGADRDDPRRRSAGRVARRRACDTPSGRERTGGRRRGRCSPPAARALRAIPGPSARGAERRGRAGGGVRRDLAATLAWGFFLVFEPPAWTAGPVVIGGMLLVGLAAGLRSLHERRTARPRPEEPGNAQAGSREAGSPAVGTSRP